jgi:hypothetical protein
VDAGGSSQSLVHIRQTGRSCDSTDRDNVAAVEGMADYSVGEGEQELKFLRTAGSYSSTAKGIYLLGHDNIS